MPVKNDMFLFPKDVGSFGFDWGQLALTVAPEVNGAERFSGGVVYVSESRFHSTLNTGTEPMQLFVVYSPAGPELGLRDRPDISLILAGK